MRKLYKVNVMKMGDTYSFNYEGKVKVYRGSEVGLKLLLRRLGASDNVSEPRSFRGKTFDTITQEIVSQSDPFIYVWSNIMDKMQMIVTESLKEKVQTWNIRLGTQVNFDYMQKVTVFINDKEYVYELDSFTWYNAKELFNKRQYNKFVNKMKPYLVKEEK